MSERALSEREMVQRYDLEDGYDSRCESSFSYMSECADGDYVLFDDYARLEARVGELERRPVEQLIGELLKNTTHDPPGRQTQYKTYFGFDLDLILRTMQNEIDGRLFAAKHERDAYKSERDAALAARDAAVGEVKRLEQEKREIFQTVPGAHWCDEWDGMFKFDGDGRDCPHQAALRAADKPTLVPTVFVKRDGGEEPDDAA